MGWVFVYCLSVPGWCKRQSLWGTGGCPELLGVGPQRSRWCFWLIVSALEKLSDEVGIIIFLNFLSFYLISYSLDVS